MAEMKNRKTLYIIAGLVLVAIIAVGGVGGYWWLNTRTSPITPQKKTFKMALIVEQAFLDGSWNEWMYNPVKQLESANISGVDLVVSYAEQVGVADFARVAGDYAKQGYDLIIAHTSDYLTAVNSLAPSYPKTEFLVTAGFQSNTTNVAGFTVASHEGYYLTNPQLR